MNFIRFPIVILSVCFGLGIFLQHELHLGFSFLLWGIFIFTVIALCFPGKLSLISSWFCWLVLGAFALQVHHVQNTTNHYSKGITSNKRYTTTFIVKQVFTSTSNYDKLKGAVLKIDGLPYTGDLMVYLKKGLVNDLNNGDTIKAQITFKMPQKQSFTDFDYKSYLLHQQITHMGFVYASSRLVHSVGTHPSFFERQRKRVIAGVQQSGLQAPTKALLLSILLADKLSIDKQLRRVFSDAGIGHLLAVSGLHIGIIILLLSHIWALCFGRRYPITRQLIMLLVLWGYVLLIGSPTSAIRAAVMFSLLLFTRLLKRGAHTLNTLFLAFIGMLVYNPYLLFGVGFQMSYAAVFFIVWLYPKLAEKLGKKGSVLQKVLQLSLVSVLAQLGILPFILYYFHGFQLLFILPNLLILPLAYLLISLGLVFLIAISWGFQSAWLVYPLDLIVSGIKKIAVYFSGLDMFRFQDVTISSIQALWLFVVLFCLGVYVHERKSGYLIALLSLILVGQLSTVMEASSSTQNQSQFAILNEQGITSIGWQKGDTLFLHGGSDKQHKMAEAYQNYVGAKYVSYQSPIRAFYYKNQSYAILNNPADLTWVIASKPDVLILDGSPKINIERLLSVLNPHQVIMTKHNKSYLIKQYQQTCNDRAVVFSLITKDGYILGRGD